MASMIRAELTRGFLMAQRTGSYLVSTCGRTPGEHLPRFDESVGRVDAREAQWERIKAAQADGTLCNVREAEERASRVIARAKLTKRLLMSLPEGVYIASNQWVPATPGPSVPRFAEHVAEPEAREAQWERIKTAGADGRHCNVYETPEDHAKWLAGQPIVGRATQPVEIRKLTKRFFLSLGTGQYIVSNVCDRLEGGQYEPCFREYVLQLEARAEQWERIKLSGSDGRLCAVFRNEPDYQEYWKSISQRANGQSL
jgi:hypothetical protein